MVDPLAVWGAATGTIGLGLAGRREYLAGRRRLAVAPGVGFNLSPTHSPRKITHAWAFVAVWNVGGRPLAVERLGFRFLATRTGEISAHEHVDLYERLAEITLQREPIELPVDGPTRKVHTPLGPLLAAGVSPVAPLEAFAVTTGNRWWSSPLQPLVRSVPAGASQRALNEGLAALREEATAPPTADHLILLQPEQPYLPAED